MLRSEGDAAVQPRRTLWNSIGVLEVLTILAFLLTGLAVHFRQALTSESIAFQPSHAGEKFYRYAYGDDMAGGASTIVERQPLDWICTLAANPNRSCGFGLLLDMNHQGRGIDLSSYSDVRLELEYEGRAEFLRIILKDHDPALSSAYPDKVNQATLSVSAGRQTVPLHLSDFVLAEWWKEQANAPASRPTFNNVVAIEFVTGNGARAGRHRIQIKEITFTRTLVSMEAWYASIALCWMLLIAFFLLQRRGRVEQWKRQLADRTLNSVPEVIWSVGPNGEVDFVSEQWGEHYGGTPKSLLGRGWLTVVHPRDRRRALERWLEAQQSGTPYECEYRIRLPDGSYRWAVARARPDFDSEGQITRWFGTCTDANDRVLAVEALKNSERLYRGILDASIDCIAVLSADGIVELVNGPGVTVTELQDARDIEGHPFTRLWQSKSKAMVSAAIAKAAAGEVSRFRSFCPTAKGTPKWWDVVLTPMPDEEGKVKGILAISRDITGDREKAEQLRWASEHDALTSLPNRGAFQSRLQGATDRAMETGGRIGLLLVDLDHFKHINDSLGHATGDEVLKAVAERLRESVRESDFVARVGGDEFAIILQRVRSEADMLGLGEKVFAQIQQPLRVGRRVLSVGASIGGAVFPKDARTANDLFKTADTALYALKGSGRGGTMMFHGYMLEEVEKAARQLGVARAMIHARSVVPVYQPKFDLDSNDIAGFEALLRWRDSRSRLQLPETVVEAFKDYELAAKIGELMQNLVAADIRSWIQRGLKFGRVSINASPAEFLRDDYAERLLAVLSEHEVPPSLVEIEVTEHALLEHGPEYVARALAKLKEAGMFVSLDDFGTGYSSLSHLRDFPVDLVKIDQSFVQQMNADPEIAAIVAAVLNLARSIDIDVVAEGVETPAQLAMLRSMGCRLAQGHLFGKAVEESTVAELLGQRRAAAA